MMRSVVLLSWLGLCYAVETPPVAGRSSGVSPSSGEKVVAGTSESAPTVAGTECGTTPAGATCGGRASPSRPAASSSATTGALPQEATTGALPAGSSSSAPQQPSSSAGSGRRDAEETEEKAAQRTRKGIECFNSALGDFSTPPRRRGSRSPKRKLHPACRFTPPPSSRWAEGFTAGFVEGQETLTTTSSRRSLELKECVSRVWFGDACCDSSRAVRTTLARFINRLVLFW